MFAPQAQRSTAVERSLSHSRDNEHVREFAFLNLPSRNNRERMRQWPLRSEDLAQIDSMLGYHDKFIQHGTN